MPPSILLVFAGPNGSGKSTITSCYPVIGDYVNADEIQKECQCDSLEAAKIAEATREKLLSEHKNFTFETVLSTTRNINLMERAKNLGYTVVCIYVLTRDAQINISRVLSRVQNGGHSVPVDKVVSRYRRAMRLFPKLLNICDECYVYDNSLERTEGEPQMILSLQYGDLKIFPNSLWSVEMLKDLCAGSYIC